MDKKNGIKAGIAFGIVAALSYVAQNLLTHEVSNSGTITKVR